MEQQNKTPVFDYRGLRLLMGLIALSLPIIVSALAGKSLTSISASYYSGARDMFVGLLFIVGAFLFAYNGHSDIESLASKIASLAALFVAYFPTACDSCRSGIASITHHVAATVLFSILAYFCFIPFRRKVKNFGGKKARRSVIYLVCGWIMIVCMVVIFVTSQVLPKEILMRLRVTYYGEAVALMAFGVAWIAAGKAFRLIADDDEIYHPFRRDV
jgi:riboflavin transporter FmnP